ncbi:MAG: UxaA family hydrolase [Planctomycetota bacterium]
MIRFEDCSRLPAPGDNVAIAVRRLEAGTELCFGERRFVIRHTVLEGHRFAFEPIQAGQPLLSWGLPFGDATRSIEAGEYACNQRILAALGGRDIDFALPGEANFTDRFDRFRLEGRDISSGVQVAAVDAPGTFLGFGRPAPRGVGTRNFFVVIGLTSNDAALAQAVAERARRAPEVVAGRCEVAAVTHTEGGGARRPLNLDFVLRALAGWCVHGNTGAVLVLDQGAGSYRLADLERFLREHGYPIDAVPHAFAAVGGAFEEAAQRASDQARALVAAAARCERSPQPLGGLKLALQCGGSDAFSGVSGNALAGWVAKELIRHGGAANLAETDELIGAESYVLQNVRSREVAARFLEKVEVFQERAARHGASAEGNPSGGNNYRGLYNIALKSLGAARKKHPDVRLDDVLDYGQPMPAGGYYFMDSPGNDLESIAGQVACGCNLILFITGNGSITNFPFVPTLKFVTTTGRFEMLAAEMDVNAGRYNDGESMEQLGAETFELVRRVASGARTKGEAAGHSQVSIWREWRQDEDAAKPAAVRGAPPPSGAPLAAAPASALDLAYEAFAGPDGPCADRVGLIMPTSICSGQVASLIAADLDARGERPLGLTRFVALAHTEGCGAANADDLYLETLAGHLRHPFTVRALLLEHGCEKTHNDAVQEWLRERGVDPSRFGYASVQLDGGIEKVRSRAADWFAAQLRDAPGAPVVPATARDLRLAVLSSGRLDEAAAVTLGRFCARACAAGATVVVPDNDALLQTSGFPAALFAEPLRATLSYGEHAARTGLHVMRAPTSDRSETVTGLGGTGVELMIALVDGASLQAHPIVPMLQVGGDGADLARLEEAALTARVGETLSRRYRPRAAASGNVRFQLTRGELGISL